jgi:hypothetical protein
LSIASARGGGGDQRRAFRALRGSASCRTAAHACMTTQRTDARDKLTASANGRRSASEQRRGAADVPQAHKPEFG